MKRTLALLPACFFSFIILISAIQDDDWLSTLLARLDSYRTNHPQEKVHLHLDKPYYSIGDDIWFKAYVVTAENNELSILSKVLYVDLVDDRDSVRKTVVLPIANGLANGDVKITDSLFTTGNYRIKAYTHWMQNFSSDLIFSKDIIIGDARTPTGVLADAKFTFNQQKLTAQVSYTNLTDKKPYANKPVTYKLLHQDKVITNGKIITDTDGKISLNETLKADYKTGLYLQTTISVANNNELQRNFTVYDPEAKTNVQFFPEGGRLVNGLRSKVAFKAVSRNGTGANVKGYIQDQSGQQVTTINTTHAGMGIFALQPVAGKTYSAVLKDAAGLEIKYPLPAAEPDGYVLAINHGGNDSVAVAVLVSKAFVGSKEVALIAQQNGKVRYITKIKTDQPVISTKLSGKRFATGLVQFTLLGADGLPLAERLLFVNHHDQLQVNISSNKPVYKAREKVDMELLVKDNEGAAVQGNFSVAVTDESQVKVNDDEEISIYSNLLLTSDLKGYIENPNYYFSSSTADKIRDLDCLLLTQGWRRFTWADVNSPKPLVMAFKPQKTLEVSGRITTLGNKPVPYGKVTLFANTLQGPILADTTADANGDFVIDDLNFADNVNVVVKVKNARDKNNVRIVLNNQQKPVYERLYDNTSVLNTATLINYLSNTQKRFDKLDDGILNKTVMLKEVKVRAKKIDKYTVVGSKKLGTAQADHVITKETLSRHYNVIQAFYGIAGVYVDTKTRKIFRTRAPAGVMQIILNGTPVSSEVLETIAPSDIEGIEIILSNYNLAVYGSMGAAGVIEVTLKSGPLPSATMPIFNVGHMAVKGYTTQREFYSPTYDKPAESHKELDLRSTIYWNPNVVSGADGKAGVSYFTADKPGTYRAVVEGIDIDGRLARQVYSFVVK